MSDTSETEPVRILLWSAGGSGEHYHGPASFTYRLYSTAPPGQVQVSLAHGFPQQEIHSLFHRQQFVHRVGRGPVDRWRFIRRGCKWIESNRSEFDVFHGITAFHHSVVPALRAERCGIPAVLFIANHLVELSDKGGLKGLLGLPRKRQGMVRNLSGMIAMSQAIYDELRGYGVPEEKIARIPMGVNTNVFYPVPGSTERSELRLRLGWLDVPTLTFVGGITERKQPHLLVEAVGRLKQAGIECQLVIVGPEQQATYVSAMKDRAKQLGITDRIVWYGFTRDIAPLFRAADFFALPSTNEGMAAALVEAMASGLAPIATRVSGSVDVIADGVDGRLVDGDASTIADVLKEFIGDPSLSAQLGRAAREKVLAYYSADAVFAAHLRLFRRIMSGGTAAE